MTALFISDVEVKGRTTDVVLENDRVAEVGPHLKRPHGVESIDGRGGALLPGLHDHHIHLLALAAHFRSVDLGRFEPGDRQSVSLALASAAATTPDGEWVRATGYHDHAGGALDRWELDQMVSSKRVRVQHRSGAAWSLNSAGLNAVGLLDGELPPGVETDEAGIPTGRLFRMDEWLRGRVPPAPVDLTEVGRCLVAAGITGVTDATPWTTSKPMETIAEAVKDRTLPLRVTVMGDTRFDPRSVPNPLEVGPAKIIVPDHQLPGLDEILAGVRAARSHSRPVAIHCVTRAALVLALAALRTAGPHFGDRIEHAAMAGPDLIPLMREALVTVVTQPNFVAERGDDYLLEVPEDERPELWPCSSLVEGGVPVAAGTDAPHGRPDPWSLMHAAATRMTRSGVELSPSERITRAAALHLLLTEPLDPGGPPRRVEPGSKADLCLLQAPLEVALAELPANPVRATIVDGSVVHLAG